MTLYTPTLDAAALGLWLTRATTAVISARSQIDAVNVYPVADSDTGTNLSLTLMEGRAEIAPIGAPNAEAPHAEAQPTESPSDRDALEGEAPERIESASTLLARFARGALLGARGNSGVIVSQFFRGMALSASVADALTPAELAIAIQVGAEEARRAVSIPVEGTILTVLSAAAQAAVAAATAGDMAAVTTQMAMAARKALYDTPGQLVQLEEAGVLDAGALGMVIILDELAAVVTGDPAEPIRIEPPSFSAPQDPGAGTTPFEVMYVLRSNACPPSEIDNLRERLDEIGESVVVVGGDGLWQVHVHTGRPDLAIAAGAGMGIRRQLTVRHLEDSVRHEDHNSNPVPFGLVVCTAAPQLVARLALTGAVVIAEPSGRCPSVTELRRAARETGAERVAIVPGDPAVLAVALELKSSRAGVRVPGMQEPTTDVIEAVDLVSALICASVYRHGSADSADDQLEAIRAALAEVRVAQLPPSALALAPDLIAADLLGAVLTAETELVTVVRGGRVGLPGGDFGLVVGSQSPGKAVAPDAPPGDALDDALHRLVGKLAPEAELVIYSGGQLAPALVVGAE